MEMQLQTKDTLATLHLDPRTKLYLLIVGNVALFLAPSLLYEIALVVCVVILGVLVGAKRFTVRMAAIYAGMVVLHIIGTNYLTGTLQIAIVTFTVFIRKIFPCAMLGGILVSTTRVNEFMAAMNRIHMPKAMVIPMTVMDEDHFLHLTDVGREVAEKIYERHCFFTEQLIAAGVDPRTAEADACRIEHIISDESFSRLKEAAEQEQT